MTANEFMLGSFAGGTVGMQKIQDLLKDKDKPVDPDHEFAEYSTDQDLGDGSRRGAGFPNCTWHWTHLNAAQLKALRTICPGASAQVYIRIPTNDTDLYGELEWGTFTANMLWPSGARGKVAKTMVLDFELTFRTLVQVE